MEPHASVLMEYMNNVIQYYQNYMVNVRYPEDRYDDPIWKQNKKLGFYGFVPSRRIIELTRTFKVVFDYLINRTDGDCSFLDAGCGAGNVLLIANSVGFTKVTGIEFDEKTVEIARGLIKPAVCSCNDQYYKIIEADITKYSKYKDYDVIYYFQPIRSEGGMSEFLHLLRKNIKVGAVVIANGTCQPFKDDRRFKRILKPLNVSPIDGIYEKVK